MFDTEQYCNFVNLIFRLIIIFEKNVYQVWFSFLRFQNPTVCYSGRKCLFLITIIVDHKYYIIIYQCPLSIEFYSMKLQNFKSEAIHIGES